MTRESRSRFVRHFLWASGFLAALLVVDGCDGVAVVGQYEYVPPKTTSSDASAHDVASRDVVDVNDADDAALDVVMKDGGADDAIDAYDAMSDAVDVMDDAVDALEVASDAGPLRCMGDGDCAGHPDGAFCDVTSGRCVQCVALNDTCPPDRHCDPTSYACVPGCRADEGCVRPGEDGGMATQLRCNTTTRTCEQCVTDAHCPTGQRCAGGLCVPGCTDDGRCAAGERCCGGACVDTRSNDQHCGACGTRCVAPNGDPACVAGACTIARCVAPFGDCDGAAANGCETNTHTAVAHCGRCGNACPARAHATAACALGACGFICDPGFADCNGDASDGCEADLGVSASHCGACGRVCVIAQGTASCRAGACGIAACNPGFADCNMSPTDGCEAELAASVSHCGACGRACSAPNGTPACQQGRCKVISCAAGFADCDGDPANGCETGTRSNVSSCGACGRTCPAPAGCAAACVEGVCGATCPAGTVNCANACVDLRTSDAHCGACGRACDAGQACVDGACMGRGPLRFTLGWDADGDMDLHVLPPCGTEIYHGRPAACGGTLDGDDTARGPEVISWRSSYTPGIYRVCPVAFNATVANALWTLTVVRDGVEVHRSSGQRGRTDVGVACDASFPGVITLGL